MSRSRTRAFTLIELLIVVAIIGIIAAILIPNLLDALQKAKQKRSTSDIRNIGTAWMSWLTDQAGASSAGAAKVYSPSLHNAVSYPQLLAYLHPNNSFYYMQEIPQADAWHHDLGFAMNPNVVHTQVIILCSSGRGGVYQQGPSCNGGPWTVGPFIVTDYDQDIVWADGYFVRWPE